MNRRLRQLHFMTTIYGLKRNAKLIYLGSSVDGIIMT